MSDNNPILDLTEVLHLGMIDEDAFDQFQSEKETYFRKYHELFWDSKVYTAYKHKKMLFRGEGADEWITPRSTKGNNIKNLQAFLQDHGFMPGARLDGVFGYWTLASLRLFQEYIRTIEGLGVEEVGMPDGRVWKNTHKHMMRWRDNKLYCSWGPNEVNKEQPREFKWTKPSKEYNLWMKLLNKSKDHCQTVLDEADSKDDLLLFQLQDLENYAQKTDSRKVSKWSYKPEEIHLIGIRRKQEQRAHQRGNDDLFVLLMNGMVFKFWGSTDPQPAESKDQEPYLIEGQHKYKLAWHKVSNSTRIYKALRPYGPGVLVYRDWGKNDALIEEDIRKGLSHNPTKDKKLNNPNTLINIHWTFDGKTNWSAGCQVISGRSYINNEGKLVDCSTFSAAKYSTLSSISQKGVRRNRGAYTFISDFIMAYSSTATDHLLYTLCNDEVINKFSDSVLHALLAFQSLDIRDQFEAADDRGLIAGFIAQMRKSKNIKKDPKSKA